MPGLREVRSGGRGRGCWLQDACSGTAVIAGKKRITCRGIKHHFWMIIVCSREWEFTSQVSNAWSEAGKIHAGAFGNLVLFPFTAENLTAFPSCCSRFGKQWFYQGIKSCNYSDATKEKISAKIKNIRRKLSEQWWLFQWFHKIKYADFLLNKSLKNSPWGKIW